MPKRIILPIIILMPKNVVWFDEVDKEDGGLVGGKGANLGEMAKSGFPVPDGFIVTSHAYFQVLKENQCDRTRPVG